MFVVQSLYDSRRVGHAGDGPPAFYIDADKNVMKEIIRKRLTSLVKAILVFN